MPRYNEVISFRCDDETYMLLDSLRSQFPSQGWREPMLWLANHPLVKLAIEEARTQGVEATATR